LQVASIFVGDEQSVQQRWVSISTLNSHRFDVKVLFYISMILRVTLAPDGTIAITLFEIFHFCITVLYDVLESILGLICHITNPR